MTQPIPTTHVGSLPRGPELTPVLLARDHGEPYDAAEFDRLLSFPNSPPEGAFYLYPNCSALIGRRRPDGAVIGSDDELSLYLLDQARVAVVQGSAYGLSPHFRISIATSMDLIEKAIGRIADAVKALR